MIEITFFVLLSQLGFLLPLAFFWVDSEDYPWKSGAKYGDTAGVHCVVHKVQEGITRLSSSPSRDLNIHRERSFFGNSVVPIIQWLYTRFLPRTSPRWCGIMPTLWNMSPKRLSSINRGRFKLCETKHLELLKLRKMEDILHQLIWRISHFLEGFINDRWLFGISSINGIFETTSPPPQQQTKSIKKSWFDSQNARHFFKVDWKTTPRIVLSASAALMRRPGEKLSTGVWGRLGEKNANKNV